MARTALIPADLQDRAFNLAEQVARATGGKVWTSESGHVRVYVKYGYLAIMVDPEAAKGKWLYDLGSTPAGTRSQEKSAFRALVAAWDAAWD